MADQTDFKHITVNPGDADDVVIQAGIVASDASDADIDIAAVSASADADAGVDADASAPASVDAAEASSTVAVQTANAPAPARPADTYHETTLEDIESSKMPKAQIIVIVIAILGIAAFAIWNMVAA